VEAPPPVRPAAGDATGEPAVVVLSRDGIIERWSEAAEALFGFRGEDATGRQLTDLVLPEELRAAYGPGLGVFEDGTTGELRCGVRWSIPTIGATGGFRVVEVEFEPAQPGTGDAVLARFWPHPLRFTGSSPESLSASLLERIFRNAPETITLIRADRLQTVVSARGLDLLGYGPTFGLPIDGTLLVHPEDVDRLRDIGTEPDDERGLPVSTRYRVRAADGSWRWLESVATDLRDDPVVQGWIVFSRDVTRDAERAQALVIADARLAAVVTSHTAATMLEADDGTIVLRNAAFTDLAGLDPDEAHPVDARAALASITRRATDPPGAVASLRRLAATAGPGLVALADGRTLEVEALAIGPTRARLGRLWLLRDVTDRVTESQRRDRLLRLEQQARELAEAKADELRRFDRVRTDFVATVSHELRTPLTAILSATDLLITGTPEERVADMDRFLDIVQRNALRLGRLVEDLLVLSRLDAGLLTLAVSEVDLGALVTSVAHDLASVANQRDVEIVVRADSGPPVAGDPLRLHQIVENLVTNAIKFTHASTKVEITVAPADDGWTIDVRDHGPGVPEAEAERVFERFYRSTAHVGAVPGTGLGLAIAKGLVVLHGGTLVVTNAPDGGARFRCALPDAVRRQASRS
jgi:PAS domain S-box-containing protein